MEALYGFYDDFLKGYGLACQPGCSTCCTRNIVATTLEVRYAMAHERRAMTKARASLGDAVPGYRPSITINASAAYCLRGEDLPEDLGNHREGRCPLLDDRDMCRIYPYRPFSCRAMVSSVPCRERGKAEMEPYLITVNFSIQQILEQMDEGGLTGNLWDVVACVESGDRGHLVPNEPIPGFLVLPGEKGRFHAFLRRLSKEVGLTLPLS